MATTLADLRATLKDGKYGYKFKSGIVFDPTDKDVPPRGQVIQRIKVSTVGLYIGEDGKVKKDSSVLYVADSVPLVLGGVVPQIDENSRYIADPKKQKWIIRYSKVEIEGTVLPPDQAKNLPFKNGDQTKDSTKYDNWGKIIDKSKFNKWYGGYQYLYTDAKEVKASGLDQKGIDAQINDKTMNREIKGVLDKTGKKLGETSLEALGLWTYETPKLLQGFGINVIRPSGKFVGLIFETFSD